RAAPSTPPPTPRAPATPPPTSSARASARRCTHRSHPKLKHVSFGDGGNFDNFAPLSPRDRHDRLHHPDLLRRQRRPRHVPTALPAHVDGRGRIADREPQPHGRVN